MSTQVLFPTLVYQGRLRLRGWRRLNARGKFAVDWD